MTDAPHQPMPRFLLILTVASTMGLQGWQLLFNNFAVDVVGLGGGQVVLVRSLREIPGFLALLVGFVLMLVREHRLSGWSVICLGTGVALTGFLPSRVGLVLTTMFMSFGFHQLRNRQQLADPAVFQQGDDTDRLRPDQEPGRPLQHNGREPRLPTRGIDRLPGLLSVLWG